MAIQQTFMYFHRLFCLSALLLLARFGYAQENLIKNPSCEQCVQIPDNLAQYTLCVDWWKPYVLTTDYFTNLTSPTNYNFIPSNGFGYQNSAFGNYYLGIALCDWVYSMNDFNNFREDYVGGQFKSTLIKNKIYQFEFWISKAEKGLLQSNAIDLIITYDTLVNVNNYSANGGYKVWSESLPMIDTVNWEKISICFKANGGEKAFSIGNYHDKSEVIKNLPLNPVDAGDIDYRYLDNFSLIECPSCCPEQFEDEPLVYVFSNPSTIGSPASLEIWLHPNTTGILELYDGAGRLVAKETYSNLQNIFSLARFAKGMYQYVYQTSDGLIESGKVVVVE